MNSFRKIYVCIYVYYVLEDRVCVFLYVCVCVSVCVCKEMFVNCFYSSLGVRKRQERNIELYVGSEKLKNHIIGSL